MTHTRILSFDDWQLNENQPTENWKKSILDYLILLKSFVTQLQSLTFLGVEDSSVSNAIGMAIFYWIPEGDLIEKLKLFELEDNASSEEKKSLSNAKFAYRKLSRFCKSNSDVQMMYHLISHDESEHASKIRNMWFENFEDFDFTGRYDLSIDDPKFHGSEFETAYKLIEYIANHPPTSIELTAHKFKI